MALDEMMKMGMGKRFAVGLVLIACFLPVSAARAEVRMQALLSEDGSGRLFVNNSGEPPWSWEACDATLTTCRPFGTGREINTGNTPAGTVFRVTGGGDSGLSPIWHGNVSAVSPPSVLGEIRANKLVVPWIADWTGGWEGDFDQTQLAACVLPSGNQCTSITEPKYIGGCRNGGTVIDPAFTGQYLRVADRRYGTGTAFTMEGAMSPYGHEIWRESPTTAVAVLGRIKPAAEPPDVGCGPSPLVDASISSRGVATVRCGLGCRVVLLARQGRRKAKVSHKLAPLPAVPIKLRLRAGQLRRFEPKPLHLIVKVDGRRVTQRTVRFD